MDFVSHVRAGSIAMANATPNSPQQANGIQPEQR